METARFQTIDRIGVKRSAKAGLLDATAVKNVLSVENDVVPLDRTDDRSIFFDVSLTFPFYRSILISSPFKTIRGPS